MRTNCLSNYAIETLRKIAEGVAPVYTDTFLSFGGQMDPNQEILALDAVSAAAAFLNKTKSVKARANMGRCGASVWLEWGHPTLPPLRLGFYDSTSTVTVIVGKHEARQIEIEEDPNNLLGDADLIATGRWIR